MSMQPADVVSIFNETDALLSGHFELRSGLHSDQFFQCAKVLQYPLISEQLCGALVSAYLESGPSDLPTTVIAPALGGITVGHDVARALGVRSVFAEKQDGVLALRRFAIEPGERVLVAEDVITRGGRVRETLDIVRARGAVPIGVLVLVDRSGGTVSFDVPLISLLNMVPEVWDPAECPLCRDGIPIVHPGS